jgi:hypothetical protein
LSIKNGACPSKMEPGPELSRTVKHPNETLSTKKLKTCKIP